MTDDEMEITDLSGVGSGTADKIRAGGYYTIENIAIANPMEMADDVSGVSEDKAEDYIQSAREMTGIGGFETAQQRSKRNTEYLQFRVPEIDEILEGGLRAGNISEVYGEFGSGKSQLTHQFSVHVQLSKEHGGLDGRALFIDTESTFREERIDDMVRGLDDEVLEFEKERRGIEGDLDDEAVMDELVADFLSKIHVAEAFNSTHQQSLVKNIVPELIHEHRDSDRPVKMLVVDSLTGHYRGEYQGRGNLASRQQHLNEHLQKINQLVNDPSEPIVGLVTNQVQSDPGQMFGDPTKPIGGNIMGHICDYRFYLVKNSGETRTLKIKDAPDLADLERQFVVTDDGCKPT